MFSSDQTQSKKIASAAWAAGVCLARRGNAAFPLTLSPCLGFHLGRAPLDLRGVAKVTPRADAEISAQVVDAGNAGGDVQVHDLLLAEPVEVLHQRAQAVAMRRYEHASVGEQVGNDRVIPGRQHPRYHLLQALRAWEQLRWQRRVSRVARGMHLVARL